MRYQSYLNTATTIINAYKGEEPLANHLKKFFAADKKYGSKDRRQVAALCYAYYRLGKAALDLPPEERILLAVFLCEQVPNEFLRLFKPDWNEHTGLPVEEKLSIAGISCTEVFPFTGQLSEGIDADRFSVPFFRQPHLFLRIRPGKKRIVEQKLKAAGLAYQLINDDCIALPNGTKLDGLIEPDKEAVVQDLNSQQVLNALNTEALPATVAAWDCCAASGGKSILLYDRLQGKVQLTVSDIRESILSNLKKRFFVAGIKNYRSFIINLDTGELPSLQLPQQQLIICDAPCTGSGTWARTPEQLFYFDGQQIDVYAERQFRIASRVIPYLEEGGLFIYITCSVFKQENEAVVDRIKEKFHLQVLQVEILKGYDQKADSMFVAVLQR